jgi:hypothetical protein
MSANARHSSSLPAPPKAGAWRAAGVALVSLLATSLLSCWSGEVAAAETGALLAEVTAVRSHIMAPAMSAAYADGRSLDELAGVSYRVWLSRGRADLGLGLGTLGYVVPPAGGRADSPHTLAGLVPTVTLGLRLRVSPESALYADASSARGLALERGADFYNAKVGMEWKPAKSRLGLEHGSLGIQFDSGYRMSLRARHGGLGVYLRSKF